MIQQQKLIKIPDECSLFDEEGIINACSRVISGGRCDPKYDKAIKAFGVEPVPNLFMDGRIEILLLSLEERLYAIRYFIVRRG